MLDMFPLLLEMPFMDRLPRTAFKMPTSFRQALIIVLVLSAGLNCYWLGPLHKKSWRLYDFGSIYASACAMVQGTNPYDMQNCAAVWRQRGGRNVWGVPFTDV